MSQKFSPKMQEMLDRKHIVPQVVVPPEEMEEAYGEAWAGKESPSTIIVDAGNDPALQTLVADAIEAGVAIPLDDIL